MPYRSFARESATVMVGQTHKFPFPCSPNAHHFPVLLLLLPHTIPWLQGRLEISGKQRHTLLKRNNVQQVKRKRTFCLDMVKMHIFQKKNLLANKLHNTFLACFIDASIILLTLQLLPIICYQYGYYMSIIYLPHALTSFYSKTVPLSTGEETATRPSDPK